MLYRTHHHSFFSHFNPFTFSSSAISLPPPPPPPPPPPSSTASVQGMECALKSCVRPELACLDNEFPAVGNCQGGGGVSGDDFFVDDLLDLSNGFAEEYEEKEKTEQPEEMNEEKSTEKSSLVLVSVLPEKQQEELVKEEAVAVTFSIEEDFSCLPGGEINAPADDLDSLEWLSHFVEEDSFSGYSLTYPVGKLPPPKPAENKNRAQTEIPVRSFTTPVQTKARSKRARTGVRVWLSGSPSLTESSTSSSSSTTTMSSSPPHPFFMHPNPGQTAESLIGIPPAKKQKKKATQTGGGGGQQQPRRCSHCGVQKTPQWRAGPLGAKTLCNACGVRYKSGRLLPEYRPACSPTFSSQLHSNNHRKVLEMRRKKELEAGSGLAQPVQSF